MLKRQALDKISKAAQLEKLIAAVRYLFSPKEMTTFTELPFLTVRELHFRMDILEQALKEYDEEGSEGKELVVDPAKRL
jgi:hypothetical protein